MTLVLRAAGVAATLVAVIVAVHGIGAVPQSDMSASRVVPAVVLARGFPLYAGPASGPIIDFMYGPVAALALLPAAIASTPSAALAIAVVVNAAWFFLPMVWLHLRAGGRPDVGLAALVLFALVVLRDPGLTFSALTIHADAPALGLGAIACGLASGRRARPAAVATSAALALWTKQTMAPLVVALIVYAWAREGRRGAFRLIAWLGVFGLGIGGIACLWFGATPLFFNMVVLPGRMPWYGDATTSRWATALFVAGLVARLTWLPAMVAIGLFVRAHRRLASIGVAPLLAGAALALAPAAIVGGAKVGGYLNTFSVMSYFLVAAATVGLAAAARADDRVARGLLVAGLVGYALVLGTGPVGVRSLGASLAQLRAWTDNPHERAFRAARAHPGEIDFPWNPLAVLLAEDRLDNNEIGAWNRDLAGVPIDDALWRRHLPPRLRLMAHRPPTGAFTWLPEPTVRLPEFTQPTSLPGLEGFTVLGTVAGPAGDGLERDPHGAALPPHP